LLTRSSCIISLLYILLFSSFNVVTKAQNISEAHPRIQHCEDSLKKLSDSILDGREQGVRQQACYDFIKTLVQALKENNSFSYPFDSLTRISILYPDDKSFRIFNWQLPLTSGRQRFFGVIQMKEKKGLEIYPLYDYSDYMKSPADTVTNNEKWYGALYYKIMQVKRRGKNYYMLFGWDGNNLRSNKKVLDVLTFNKKREPEFGASIFNFETENTRNNIKRLIIEYKEDAQVSMNYDAELKMIVYDHLIPQDPSSKDLLFTYVPDGSYEALRWKRGKWNYVENVFTSTMREPVFPKPVNFEKEKLNKR
jgi:hypothetical protein